MSRTKGYARYQWLIKYIDIVLVVCFLIWVTPHTVILSASEVARLGGSHHRILGPLSIMPAKNVAVNLMLVATFLSFQLYRRSDKVATVSWAPAVNDSGRCQVSYQRCNERVLRGTQGPVN